MAALSTLTCLPKASPVVDSLNGTFAHGTPLLASCDASVQEFIDFVIVIADMSDVFAAPRMF
jgi:hypothetical protein